MNFTEFTVKEAALEWFPLCQGYGGQVWVWELGFEMAKIEIVAV